MALTFPQRLFITRKLHELGCCLLRHTNQNDALSVTPSSSLWTRCAQRQTNLWRWYWTSLPIVSWRLLIWVVPWPALLAIVTLHSVGGSLGFVYATSGCSFHMSGPTWNLYEVKEIDMRSLNYERIRGIDKETNMIESIWLTKAEVCSVPQLMIELFSWVKNPHKKMYLSFRQCLW